MRYLPTAFSGIVLAVVVGVASMIYPTASYGIGLEIKIDLHEILQDLGAGVQGLIDLFDKHEKKVDDTNTKGLIEDLRKLASANNETAKYLDDYVLFLTKTQGDQYFISQKVRQGVENCREVLEEASKRLSQANADWKLATPRTAQDTYRIISSKGLFLEDVQTKVMDVIMPEEAKNIAASMRARAKQLDDLANRLSTSYASWKKAGGNDKKA